MSNRWNLSGPVVAGAAAAVGASACCVGPLLLVLLGVGGAWGSRLVSLEPFQPWLSAAALACFAVGFSRLRRSADACTPGQACAVAAVRRRRWIGFWVVAALAAMLMSFPLYAPLFY